jgi:hypothetical protein
MSRTAKPPCVTRARLSAPALLSIFLTACRAPSPEPDPYFGQARPQDVPAVFAPDVISLDGRFEQFLLYAPDGRTITFGVTNGDWSDFSLFRMTMGADGWSAAEAVPYLGGDPNALTACASFDGNSAFFTSARPSYPPANVWRSRRADDGWSPPVRLDAPISSDGDEWEVAIARNGTLYFSSNRPGGEGDLDIYRSRPVGGAYVTAENLGPPVNTSAGDDLPYIAPDESYLVFASDRPGGLGHRDLYISFRQGSRWTGPVNLGAPINSAAWDIYPSVSPDGEYFFFTRRESWETSEDSDILWVSAAFIGRLRERATRPAGE